MMASSAQSVFAAHRRDGLAYGVDANHIHDQRYHQVTGIADVLVSVLAIDVEEDVANWTRHLDVPRPRLV